jgi:DUF4097 and DUF4098 domain-containing protein YvlB
MQFIASLFLVGVFYSSEVSLLPSTTYQLVSDNFANNSVDETERFEQIYPFNSDGKISIDNVNGSIWIEAWDKNEIKFEYTKTADSKERLSEVEVKINSNRDFFKVSTEYDQVKRKSGYYTNGKYYKLQVEYRLFVPKNARLDTIETVNGSIYISKMENIVVANAVNGTVKGENLRGTVKLETVNGASEASFDGIENKGLISIETVNGSAILTIPSDADATIKAETLNGSINNDFGMFVKKGKYVGKNLYSKLGNGESQIKLSSVNGGLTIRRKNDGKQIKTVTNLLSTHKDDDNYQGHYPISPVAVAPIPPVSVNIPPISVNVPPVNLNFPAVNVNIPPIAPYPTAIANTEEVKAAQEEYQAAVKEYQSNLKSAQAELTQAQKEYQNANSEYNLAIKNAQNELAEARKNATSQEASKTVQAEYEEVLREAKASLDEKRKEYHESIREYNSAIKEAQGVLQIAQKKYQKALVEKYKKIATTYGSGISYSTNWDYSTATIDKKSDSFVIKGVPTVTIDTPNCAVTVRGWDKSEVAYTISKLSKNQNSKPIEFDIKNTDSEVSIKSVVQNLDKTITTTSVSKSTNQSFNFYQEKNEIVRIEVFVPKKTNLKISSEEEVRLEGVSGNLEIIGNDESINVRDSEGTLKLSNTDGRVRIIGFKGELDSKTDDGEVFLEGDFSKINAIAFDGTYTLTLAENTNADVSSNLKSLQYGDAEVNVTNGIKIGKGGAKYNFMLEDGKVILLKSKNQK